MEIDEFDGLIRELIAADRITADSIMTRAAEELTLTGEQYETLCAAYRGIFCEKPMGRYMISGPKPTHRRRKKRKPAEKGRECR